VRVVRVVRLVLGGGKTVDLMRWCDGRTCRT